MAGVSNCLSPSSTTSFRPRSKPTKTLAKPGDDTRPTKIVKEGVGKLLLQDAKLQGLLKTLSPGKLTDTQAEQALSLMADSLLVQQMNNATVAWFVANGAEEPEAKLLTQRLSHALPGHLLTVIAQNAPPLAQLQKFVRLGSRTADMQNSVSGVLATSSSSLVR